DLSSPFPLTQCDLGHTIKLQANSVALPFYAVITRQGLRLLPMVPSDPCALNEQQTRILSFSRHLTKHNLHSAMTSNNEDRRITGVLKHHSRARPCSPSRRFPSCTTLMQLPTLEQALTCGRRLASTFHSSRLKQTCYDRYREPELLALQDNRTAQQYAMDLPLSVTNHHHRALRDISRSTLSLSPSIPHGAMPSTNVLAGSSSCTTPMRLPE
ncbi:hypothetical protein R3P38DRAFT_3422596, partial [Favolaschia claudopus]